jgi:hypothetical protein
MEKKSVKSKVPFRLPTDDWTRAAALLLDLFDRYKPEKAVVIPPALFGLAR